MGRLKGVPSVLSPDILHLLSVTGHGDEIVLADINFPTHSLCQGSGRPQEFRADGVAISVLLDAILTLMPLDWYHPWQLAVMDMTASDKQRLQKEEAPVVELYRDTANTHERAATGATDRSVVVEKIERFQFYEHAKHTYAVIHTGDTAAYANVILKRGVC